VVPRLVGLVADDLTGAMDAAVQFAQEGMSAHVLCRRPARPPVVERAPSLLAVVTGVRGALDDEAAAGTAGAVEDLLARGCDRLYVKVDSTMRGSVAGQLRGAFAAWVKRHRGTILVLCPAYPDEGRAVVRGTVLVDGSPVDRTSAASDAITPVVESRLDRLVPGATQVLPAALASTAGNGVSSDAARIVFVDASTDADLDDIAAALDGLGPQGVAAGAAGLAAAMARRWSGGDRPAGTIGRPAARVLIAVSSLHPTARESVERLRRAFADNGERGRPAVDAMTTGERLTDASAIAAGFGEQVVGRLATGAYDTLVLVGGDGAAAVLDGACADAIEVEAALAPGVPVGRIVGGAFDGLRVVTKSGGFGRSDSLLRIVNRLQSNPFVRKERP
jgi:uncharacterized protein YgbK (DUF1537 family)